MRVCALALCLVGACSSSGLPLGGADAPTSNAAPPTALPITIAQTHRPWGLTVDDTSVYWTTADGEVFRAPKHGGAPESLAANEDAPTDIVVDGERVYWVDAHALRSMPKSGGAVTSLLRDVALSSVLAADDTHLYCAATDVGAILQLPKVGGATTQLIGGQQFGLGILGLAVDADAVYFTNHWDASVVAVPLGGASSRIIASAQPAPYAVAVRDHAVYWSRNNRPGVVMRASSVGSVSPVADGQSLPWAITTDAQNVYWLDVGDGSVWRARLDGQSAMRIAQKTGFPTAIAVDDDTVFWSDRTSDVILAVAK